jgi:hypothetical protein
MHAGKQKEPTVRNEETIMEKNVQVGAMGIPEEHMGEVKKENNITKID